MKRPLVLLGFLAAVTAPRVAHAQVELTPRIGVFFPLEDLTVGTDPLTGLPVTTRAATKFTIGGRLGVWLTPVVGVEGVVDYNKGGVRQTLQGAAAPTTIGSHYFATSGRVMGKLHGPGTVAFILSAGGGLVDRGGDFINDPTLPGRPYTGRTDFAGAAGLGMSFKISQHVAGRLDADLYTYKAQYNSVAFGATSDRRQYDLIISFGLTGPFRDYGSAAGD
jgi:hypothetical protein